MKRNRTFKFFDTMEQAKQFNKTIKRHLRGSICDWQSQDGKEKKIVVWFKW